jgi:fibronectin type 3 domain-containing protein
VDVRGANAASDDDSRLSTHDERKRVRRREGSGAARVRRACKAVVENLESRIFLSATNDGFTAAFYGGYYSDLSQFPALGNVSAHAGDYVTHMDVINTPSGNQSVAPFDAPSNFNPAAGSGNQGSQFSGRFSATVSVATAGYYTFYPSTDDAAYVVLDKGTGNEVDFGNLTEGRGVTQDVDTSNTPWAANSTHTVDLFYNNGGGGWGYELRWSASSGTSGGGTSLIPYSLMTGAGAPGVANVQAPAPTSVPPTPTVANTTEGSVTLSWSTHDVDAASYIIERSTSGAAGTFSPLNSANPIPSADGGTLKYIDAGLSPGTTYYYKLVGNSLNGSKSPGVASEPTSSAASATTTTSAPTLAAAPLTVAASTGGNVVTFGQVPNAYTYQVLESATVNGSYSVAPGASTFSYSTNASTTFSYTDTGNNANSFYEIKAADSNGDFKASSPATLLHGDGFGASYYTGSFNGASTFSSSTVFKPSTLAATPTFSTIIPTINSGPLNNTITPPYAPANFNIAQGSGNQGNAFSTEFDFTVVAPTSEQYTFLPRTDDGVQLTVDGQVLDAHGTRGSTTDVVVVPSVWTAGSTHTIQMAYFQGAGGWEADLGWTSPSLSVLFPSAFYGSNGQPIPGFDADALGVAPSAAPTTPTVVDTPTLSVGAFSATMVNLTFTASEADSYKIFRGTSAGHESTTAVGTVSGSPGASPGLASYSFTDSGLTTGTTYFYVVKAVNSSGTGAASNEVSVTPAQVAPPAPTNVAAALTSTVLSSPLTIGGPAPAVTPTVTITWTGSAFVTGYNVLRAPVTNGVMGTFNTIVTGDTTTAYVDHTAVLGSLYQYEIVATNPTASPASSPSATAGGGVLEEYYPNTQSWGGTTSDNGATAITGIPGAPSESSFQPGINYIDSSQNDSPPGGTQGFTYSTIFTGKLNIRTTGTYTFAASTDDDGILYVDGQLVAAGSAGSGSLSDGKGNPVFSTGVAMTLNGGRSYDFVFFHEQGGGNQRFELLYNGPDTSNALVIAPSSTFNPLTGVPLAATSPSAALGVGNPAGSTFPVTVTFQDNSDNEIEYQLQRSTDSAFDGNGNVTIVASGGAVVNGAPASGGAITAATGTLTDPGAPQGQTFYYRVVALNFEGSSVSGNSQALAVPANSGVSGVEVNYYNNQWWRSTNQSTTAVFSGAVGSATNPTALIPDEQAVLNNINYVGGTDGGSGTILTNSSSAKYPDPNGVIGPDAFSDVFTGEVFIVHAGTYTFGANTDDDGYLYIDDKLVSSYPGGHGPSNGETEYPIVLTAGQHNLELFHSNGGGGWGFQVFFNGPDTGNATQIVPLSALSTLMSPVVAPANFTVVPGAGGGQAVLTWNNNNTSALRYVVQRSTDPAFNSNVMTFDVGLNNTGANSPSYPASNSFTDTGLTTNTTYYYRVYAQNFDLTSPVATASVAVPPAPPVGVVALWSGSTVSLSWLADAGAESYKVYRATIPGGEGATPIASGITATQYTDASVIPGNTYYYQIVAVNASSLVSGRSFETVVLNSLPSTVIISELQAINDTTLVDSTGGHPDWLELYNPTAAAVNLNGYYLTDKKSDPTEWAIPPVSIAPGGFLVIFCDGTDQTNPAAQLHTNFSLSGSGEFVALVNPGGTQVLSSYEFPQQLDDGTYGIAMAETVSGATIITSYGATGYLNPTPGAPNGNTLGAAITPEPTFSQPGGVFTTNTSFQLTMSDAVAGAAIYYTLDGTRPSPTNGTLYTGPISVTTESSFRAVAIGPNELPSVPNSDNFIYTAQVVTQNADGNPPPGWPASWGLSIAHYGMNPAVVNSLLYSGEIQQDLLQLPTFSITMDLNDLFNPATGIYSNSGNFGSAWTKPASVQYLPNNSVAGFTANAGLAIKGDASAVSPDAVHGFRLEFESQFGQSELDYPLFSTGTSKFQEIDLRADQNNSWQYQDPQNYIGIRDEFSNATAAALGIPGQRSQICFLYINGVFWGLYDAIDRTDASWAANAYGGTSSNYDAIKSGGNHNGFVIEATDGTLSAWDQLVFDTSTLDFSSNANYEMIQGKNPDGTPNPSYPDLINVDELAQYIMLIDYVGNLDSPNSTFVGPNNPNNFYAVRPTDGSFGFQFMATDSEWTLLDVNTNRVNSSPATVTGALATPAFFYQKLEANPNFRRIVADDIQKDFFNNGPLTASSSLARFQALAAQIHGPVVDESARWGDVQSLPPYVSTPPANPYTYTRNVDWQNAINSLETSYLPQRSAIVINQLAQVGLTSTVTAPNYSQFGGAVATGYNLTITNPNSSGSIYYTLDGSDPFTLTGGISPTALLYTAPVSLKTTTEVKAAVLIGTTWSADIDAIFNIPITTVQVTELAYDPPTPPGGVYAGDDDEFIELKNFGSAPVNLQGTQFTNGIAFTFANVTLAPGQTGVVVSNPAAFAALYGTSVNVLGSYQAGGTHFNNGGEEVTIVDSTGQVMVDFTYDNAWYPTTAGGGPSLEVVNPASNPNLNLAASWQPSPESGGTPGVDDSLPTGAPTGLSASFTNQQVVLVWSAVAGAASYNVYRGPGPGGEATTPIATGVTTAGFTDSAAVGGITYYYTVTAVDPGGSSPASNEASITVPQTPFAPVLITQPASQIVNVGGTATFTATAVGYPVPTVQWKLSTDGGNTWTPIPGATSTTYSVPVTTTALDANQYQAVFTNSVGSTPSSPAILTAVAMPLTAWNFDTSDKTGLAIPTKKSTSPDPSIGSGTASSIGMALFSGPDASTITADPGSSDGNASTQQAWKIVGTNGWNSAAAIGTQGAQFLVSTAGSGAISLQFDLDVTPQGEGNLMVQYTIDGGAHWLVAPSLNANSDAGISVKTNTTSANTVQGEYFSASGSTEVWYNRLTADFSGVAGVANNPNFGVRLVNASTGADCVNLSGQPLGNTAGNWRLDEVNINGVPRPIVAPFTLIAGVEGTATTPVNGSFSGQSGDSYAATVDYGDGSGPQPIVLTGNAFTLSHAYAEEGSYPVSVVVTDTTVQLTSAAATANVSISGAVVQASITGAPATLSLGGSANLTFTATNPNPLEMGPLIETWTIIDASNAVIASGTGPTTTFTPAAAGTYTVTFSAGESSTPNAETGIATATITVTQPAPNPTSTVIGDGTAQRSVFNSVTLNFDEAVTLGSGAITMNKVTTGTVDDGLGNPNSVTHPILTSTDVTGGLTFTKVGDGHQWIVSVTPGGVLDDGFHDFLDGVYQYTLHASQITNSTGGTLSGGDHTASFLKRYGDIDGDGIVGNIDFGRFKTAFGKSAATPPVNTPAFDIDHDGIVGNIDFGRFKTNFSKPQQFLPS